jgi:hypothetical protein
MLGAALAGLGAGCANRANQPTTTADRPVVTQTTVAQDTAAKTVPGSGGTTNSDFPPPPPRTEPPMPGLPSRRPPPPPPAAAAAPAETGMRELFPHVRADVGARVVEFDGTVPINCHDPATPDVFLEVTVCTPDTKEHEALVVTPARPSHVHAALLAIGLKPGAPGSWRYEDKKLIALPPTGDPVDVTIAYRDAQGAEVESPANRWVKTADADGAFAPRKPGPAWVFAGSVFAHRRGEEVYDADGTGVLIGLTTFGSEVVAWADTLSPESSVQEPEWIADPAKVPRFGTPVVVRIRPWPGLDAAAAGQDQANEQHHGSEPGR